MDKLLQESNIRVSQPSKVHIVVMLILPTPPSHWKAKSTFGRKLEIDSVHKLVFCSPRPSVIIHLTPTKQYTAYTLRLCSLQRKSRKPSCYSEAISTRIKSTNLFFFSLLHFHIWSIYPTLPTLYKRSSSMQLENKGNRHHSVSRRGWSQSFNIGISY